MSERAGARRLAGSDTLYFVIGMHIIIGTPPHIIMTGMPMAIIELMASQRSFMRDIIAGSVGIIFIIMPSFVISQDILHIIGVMPAIIGIIIGIIGMPFIIIMPFIIGMPFIPFIPFIMGFMPFIIGIGIPFIMFMPFIIGIGIGIIGIPLFIGMLFIGIIGIAFMESSSIELAAFARPD